MCGSWPWSLARAALSSEPIGMTFCLGVLEPPVVAFGFTGALPVAVGVADAGVVLGPRVVAAGTQHYVGGGRHDSRSLISSSRLAGVHGVHPASAPRPSCRWMHPQLYLRMAYSRPPVWWRGPGAGAGSCRCRAGGVACPGTGVLPAPGACWPPVRRLRNAQVMAMAAAGRRLAGDRKST